MTIGKNNRMDYTGNGAVDTYSFNFKVFSASDLRVTVRDTAGNETQLTYPTHFTVTGVGVAAGGSVALVNNSGFAWLDSDGDLKSDFALTIRRVRTVSQTTDIRNQSAVFNDVLEDAYDHLVMIDQQQQDELDRSLKLAETDDGGIGALPIAADRPGKYLAFDGDGNPIASSGTGNDSALRTDLAASTGSALVRWLLTATGAVSRLLSEKLNEIVSVDDFGVDRTGVTNTTTTLKAFYDHCVSSGRRGHVLSGTYKVTTGVLAFDTPFVDAAWPDISTDGHQAVTYSVDAATATNAPILALTNGTATSAAGKYWRGGSHGGVTFTDATGAVAAGRHGIALRGVWGTRFGRLVGNDLRGSLVSITQSLYTGNNPDPYAVTACMFEAVEANRCERYAIENQNWVGMNGCGVGFLRAVSCVQGGWFGLGAGNWCDVASIGSVGGWAFDDGTNVANTGGSPSRFRLKIAELDDVQNGIRINKLTLSDFEQIRFNHRYNFTALNPSGGYWPRKAIDINGGASPGSKGIRINATHRVEAGGAKGDMGAFVDFNSIAANDITIAQNIADNAGFGFADNELYTNLNVNSVVFLTRDGVTIADRRSYSALLARGDGTTAIGNTGWATATAKILLPSEVYDIGGNYASSQYTVPYPGLYRFLFRFALNTAAAGTRVRLGIMQNRSAALTVVAAQTQWSVAADVQTYEIGGTLDLAAGDIIYPIADQNTATASIAVSTPISHGADNVFQVNGIY